jgi:hypothetical protein
MKDKSSLDGEKLFSGFMLGFWLGGLIALFAGPRIRPGNLRQTGQHLARAGNAIRDTIESVAPGDTVSDSIAEGKEAARRRRHELGLED